MKRILDKLGKLDVVFNVLACCICLFLFKFNVWALLLGFVFSDLLFAGINSLIKKTLIFHTLKKENHMDVIDVIDKEKYRYINYSVEYKKFLEELNVAIDKQKQKQKEQEKAYDIETKKTSTHLDVIFQAIDEFERAVNNGLLGKKGVVINKELLSLKHDLESKPAAHVVIDGSFPIYLDEIKAIIINAKSHKDEEISRNVKEVKEEYLLYLKHLKNRVSSFNENSIKIDMELLLNELKSKNKNEENK